MVTYLHRHQAAVEETISDSLLLCVGINSLGVWTVGPALQLGPYGHSHGQ